MKSTSSRKNQRNILTSKPTRIKKKEKKENPHNNHHRQVYGVD